MLGAIIGDFIGSSFEHIGRKAEVNFELIQTDSKFTDDTVLTIATAAALLDNQSFAKSYASWGCRYPNARYGKQFELWLSSSNKNPYGSLGNGSAMRVSPIGWFAKDLNETLLLAKQSAEVTHNHAEGINGAQAVASAIYLARNGKNKEEIKTYIETQFLYDLDTPIDQYISSDYRFDATCEGSVPHAIRCFLEAENFEECIRKAVYLNGDTDTQAAIAGSIGEAYFGLEDFPLSSFIINQLSSEMRQVIESFSLKIKL